MSQNTESFIVIETMPNGKPILVATREMGASSLSIVVNELLRLGMRHLREFALTARFSLIFLSQMLYLKEVKEMSIYSD